MDISSWGCARPQDSELAAVVVEVKYSVIIRVTSTEDVQRVRAAPSAEDLQRL